MILQEIFCDLIFLLMNHSVDNRDEGSIQHFENDKY
jgi:hypothetical protein